jgi:CHASE2 domain-containing sensor protein
MSAAPAKNVDRSPAGTPQWFVVAALALGGMAVNGTSLAERADLMLLDRGFAVLRALDPKPVPDDIVIVGIDDATRRAVSEPPGLWHVPLAELLKRIASAKPRALALDIVLPERSMEAVRPGLDRALTEGLMAARTVETFAIGLAVDGRGEAKPVHPPFLGVVGAGRLGLVIVGRDVDGVTRRYSLALPTEDGSFPTLVGRLCAGLSAGCRQGITDYSLGSAFRYVPMAQVLGMNDAPGLERLFGGQIVFVAETQRAAERITQPLNLAAWEQAGRDAPLVLAHAQALRTALHGRPIENTNPALAVALISLAALVFLAGPWRLALACAALAGLALVAISFLALRAGLQVPVAAALVTVAAAVGARAALAARGSNPV